MRQNYYQITDVDFERLTENYFCILTIATTIIYDDYFA